VEQQQQLEKAERSPSTAITEFRSSLDKMDEQFKAALPPHIPTARFKRVVVTAVQNNPRLLRCTKQSLFNACVRAAQDGLLPDGREGAIVPYESEGEQTAQWLPMVAGIRKKVRNSGLLSDWNVQVVQEGDAFEFELGDNPFIRHKPAARGGRARKVLAAYSIATYPDGTKSREVMNVDQIEDVRKKSRAKKGPWHDPIFYAEMCRKTVAKLHAKQLPQSTDLDTLMRRDDELYDFRGQSDRAGGDEQQRKRLESTTAMLDHFANEDAGATPSITAASSETSQTHTAESKASPAAESGNSDPTESAKQSPAAPQNFDQYAELVEATCAAATSAAELRQWFDTSAQRKLRNSCNIVASEKAKLDQIINARLAELSK